MNASAIGEKMCELRVTDSADMFLAKISGVIRQNIVAIGVCVLIVVASSLVVYVVGKSGWQVISAYRSHLDKTSNKQPSLPLPQGGTTGIGQRGGDDIEYTVANGDDGGMDLPTEPEASKIAGKMAGIKARYAGYNRAMSAYTAAKRMGDKPDDLMDAGIMNRKGDDFHYNHEKRRVLHHDDGINKPND